ncbi:MAG: adenosine-3(2),5-bisphosphate nucleotidase [Micavibrio sp.]|nr:adenosine-3(2),5-bisphosphate nucleotidase [Micavibrio sp.]
MTLSPATLQLLAHLPAVCNMVRRVAVEAGDLTLMYFDEDGFVADIKADGSPVTSADREAEALIIRGLNAFAPDVPVVGEESVAAGNIPDLAGHDYFWLVDPLDGTKEFIKGSGDYTVNIALIHKGVPVLGVIYAPVPGELYSGCGEGTALRYMAESGSEKKIFVRDMPVEGLTVITSRGHNNQQKIEEFLAGFKVAKVLHRGSSLKMCMIAAGKGDIYPRPGETCEWDTAAGDAILRSAGGKIVDFDGNVLSYGHAEKKFLNPEFVASSGFWPIPDSD